MKTYHTPGEWTYKLESGRRNSHLQVIIPKHAPINVYTLDREDDCGEQKCDCIKQEWANVKLISAAPKLLNAALLNSCFPIQNEKEKEQCFELAKSMGWDMDIPVELFAMRYTLNAIKKTIE